MNTTNESQKQTTAAVAARRCRRRRRRKVPFKRLPQSAIASAFGFTAQVAAMSIVQSNETEVETRIYVCSAVLLRPCAVQQKQLQVAHAHGSSSHKGVRFACAYSFAFAYNFAFA